MGRLLLAVVPVVGLFTAGGALAGNRFPYPPIPIGVGPRFHPADAPKPVLQGRPVAGLRCERAGRRTGVHLELFALRRVVIVPAGIGIAAPRARDGAYVRPRGCTYPIRTLEPTGVLQVTAGRRLTLGHLFRLWGQPLSRTRLAAFSTSRARPVRAYVGGRRWAGPLRSIPLRRHAVIVLQLGAYVRPHVTYPFPKGL